MFTGRSEKIGRNWLRLARLRLRSTTGPGAWWPDLHQAEGSGDGRYTLLIAGGPGAVARLVRGRARESLHGAINPFLKTSD